MRGWEALPEGQEWSGGHSRGPGVVETPSLRVRSGREAIPKGE